MINNKWYQNLCIECLSCFLRHFRTAAAQFQCVLAQCRCLKIAFCKNWTRLRLTSAKFTLQKHLANYFFCLQANRWLLRFLWQLGQFCDRFHLDEPQNLTFVDTGWPFCFARPKGGLLGIGDCKTVKQCENDGTVVFRTVCDFISRTTEL